MRDKKTVLSIKIDDVSLSSFGVTGNLVKWVWVENDIWKYKLVNNL